MVSLRSPVSAIHARVQRNIEDASFFSLWRTLSCLWRDVSALARLFLGWRNSLFLFGATFLLAELVFTLCDLFCSATFSLVLICGVLLDLWRSKYEHVWLNKMSNSAARLQYTFVYMASQPFQSQGISFGHFDHKYGIAHCKNVSEKLRYPNERSTKFESLNLSSSCTAFFQAFAVN